MGDGSPIEWTDATWNPIVGCSVVSPGCTNCYAMKLAGTRLKTTTRYAGLTRDTKAGPVWTGDVRLVVDVLDQPRRWRRPRRIFVNSMGDLFHEDIPDGFIDRVFAVMAAAPQHQFQVLTKRAERMRDYLLALPERIRRGDCDPGLDGAHLPLPNVWCGVSAEDQPRADARIYQLQQTPAAVRFVSLEPMLGPIALTRLNTGRSEAPPKVAVWDCALTGTTWRADIDDAGVLHGCEKGEANAPALDWVIIGGESGPDARPMHLAWARQVRDDCAAAGVPFLFKQWGEHIPAMVFGPSAIMHDSALVLSFSLDPAVPHQKGPPGSWFEVSERRVASGAELGTLKMLRVGKKRAGRLLDGQIHDGFPAPTDPEEVWTCGICADPLLEGQFVIPDISLGTVHVACLGQDREFYVKDLDTGEPLGPDDPIPTGYPYERTAP